MTDIFISYARTDSDKVDRLCCIFQERGWSVWRDDQITSATRFAEVIEANIREASVVVICWSATAAKSEWVKQEAQLGMDQNKCKFLSLDGTVPPPPFEQYHAPSLRNWYGGMNNRHLKRLLLDIKNHLAQLPAGTPDGDIDRYINNLSIAWKYHIVALLGTYYALMSWIQTRQPSFSAPLLIDQRPVPAALFGLIIVALLLLASGRILVKFAAAHQDEHWSRRLPRIGYTLQPVSPDASYTVPKLLLLAEVLLPCAALFHLGRTVIDHGKLLRNPSGERMDYWTHLPEWPELFNDAYRLAGSDRPADGVTFLAAYETWFILLLVMAAWLIALLALKGVLWRR